MGNLLNQPIEKLEDAPSRESFHESGRERKDNRGDFDYAHFYGWLQAHVGQHIDKVTSEFTHALWVPKQHRNYSKLTETVETKTFMEDGKVHVRPRWHLGRSYVVKDLPYGEIYYVHPVTKQLCYFKSKKRKYSWEPYKGKMVILGDYHQLLKLKGIWYEVKAEPKYKKGNPLWVQTYTDSPLMPVEEKNPNALYRPYHYNDTYALKFLVFRQLNTKDLKKHKIKNDNGLPDEAKRCKICGGCPCTQVHQKVS